MFPVLFKLGPITLHTYGLMVALGFLLAFFIARYEFERQGLPEYLLDRIVFYLMVFGLLGARFFYFAVGGFEELKGNPFLFFRIWEGGLVFYGGVVAGLITLVVYSRMRELSLVSLTDAFAAPLLVGHAIGRLGCFAAGCCYGRPSDSFLYVVFSHPDSLAPKFVPLHPTQLYESAGTLILFAIAVVISKRFPKKGVLTSFYLLAYGTLRFCIEFLRGDDRGIMAGGLAPSQWLSLLLIASGIAMVLYVRRQKESN